MGPMFVGFHGALHPIDDAVKLAIKEDIIPTNEVKGYFGNN